MLLALAKRMALETDARLLWKFVYNFGMKSARAGRRFRERLARGEYYPAFLFLSVTSRCNLACQGCWVGGDGPPQALEAGTLDRVIAESKRRGTTFFGILGGEPLLYDGLWGVLEKHPDCYFQIFTNGTVLTDAAARTMRRLGNVTPLVSIEGLARTSDERRGGRGVLARTLAGLEHCRRHRLITGVATSVCRSNIDELVTEEFVADLVRRGVHYLWYYIYRPVGPDPQPDLALAQDQVLAVREFLVRMRRCAPIALIDAYWDERGRAVCPAAAGISCHVGPAGDLEPCPPVQFAADSVRDNGDLFRTVSGSAFLRAFRRFAAGTTPGCVLLERPDLLREFLLARGARDTSGRGTGLSELEAMRPRASHHLPGREVPETHWFYRLAKRNWFFGLGAYG